ncbi:hypothetical protein MMC22_007199 [Lobaria immixta]|nr:hypothetical protein [Lobaria immixta]
MRGDPPESFTLLHLASSFGIRPLAEKLLHSERRTALMCAARGRHEAVVRLLLEKGADLEAKDSNGLTALQVASKKGHIAVMQQLTPSIARVIHPLSKTDLSLVRRTKGVKHRIMRDFGVDPMNSTIPRLVYSRWPCYKARDRDFVSMVKT